MSRSSGSPFSDAVRQTPSHMLMTHTRSGYSSYMGLLSYSMASQASSTRVWHLLTEAGYSPLKYSSSWLTVF